MRPNKHQLIEKIVRTLRGPEEIAQALRVIADDAYHQADTRALWAKQHAEGSAERIRLVEEQCLWMCRVAITRQAAHAWGKRLCEIPAKKEPR